LKRFQVKWVPFRVAIKFTQIGSSLKRFQVKWVPFRVAIKFTQMA